MKYKIGDILLYTAPIGMGSYLVKINHISHEFYVVGVVNSNRGHLARNEHLQPLSKLHRYLYGVNDV